MISIIEKKESVLLEKSIKMNKPSDNLLARRWIAKHPDMVYGMECFRIYDDGIWNGIPTKVVENEILNILEAALDEGIRPNISKLNSVREIIKIIINVLDSKWNNMPNCLPFTNGLLDLSTFEWIEHSKENYIISTLPYAYDRNAKAEHWSKALHRLPKDVADFLQEYAGYSLTTDTRHEIAIWLHGTSGCGKSTIVVGLQVMLGNRSIALGPRDIESSRFNLSQLNGKTLMVSTEQPSVSMFMIDIYNKIISGSLG